MLSFPSHFALDGPQLLVAELREPTGGWNSRRFLGACQRIQRIRVKHPMSGFDYSKWDRLEISDDETTCLGLGYLIRIF